MSVEAPSRLTRPEAIVFDWDNTLIDSWAAIHDAQNYVLAHYGLPTWTMEETRKRVRGSMRDTFPQLFGDRWREAGEVFYARFRARHMDNLSPLSGAEALLEGLRAEGIYLCVVSNKQGDYLRAEADHLNFSRFFGRIVGAFDAPRDKPAAEPVAMALAGSAGCAASVWFVGDADIDMECARNAGCTPILVRHEAPGPEEFTAHPPAAHVSDCLSLLKLLRSL